MLRVPTGGVSRVVGKPIKADRGCTLALHLKLSEQELGAVLFGHALGELPIGTDFLLSTLPLVMDHYPPQAPEVGTLTPI